MPPDETLHRRLDVGLERAQQAVDEAADAWHGSFDSGAEDLVIAVRAGVRSGRLRARLTLAGDDRACHLSLTPRGTQYQLQTAVVMLLLISALASLPLMLWPFVPRLLPMLPIALVLSVGGWFLVVARLQNHGPEEFLETVALLAESPTGSPADEPATETTA
ncbi:MAG: hypothetical protein K8J08_04600 [Thermoanaerobaculia bacterium]|nr:hypothetical protein [Thermoanaerobaculia bacterium]